MIAQLKQAGIRVWVLTGDKVETAMTIGYSCNLLQPGMTNYEVTGSGKGAIQSVLNEASSDIKRDKASGAKVKRGIIVKGECLTEIFEEQNAPLRMLVRIDPT